MTVLAAATPDKEEQAELERAKARGDIVEEDEEEATEAAANDEETTEEETTEETEEDEGSKTVPHGRFNKVNEAWKAEHEARLRAEGEAEALRKMVGKKAPEKDEPAVDQDVDTLREQQYEALLEGDNKRAAALGKQVSAIEHKAAVAEAYGLIREDIAKREMESAAGAIYDEFPFLDSQSAEANAEAIDAVIVQRNLFQSRGMAPAAALAKAAKLIGNAYAVTGGGKKASIDETEAATTERDQTALKKAAAAALRQPATANGGKGERSRATASGAVDIKSLTDKQFRALPEEERAKARGDYL